MLTGTQWLRAVEAVRRWEFLDSLSMSAAPVYFYLSGLAWGSLGLLIFAGLWQGREATPRMLRFTSIAFTVYYWADRMLVASSPLRKSGWIPTAIVMIALLAAIFWILSRPKTQGFFGEKNE